MRKVRAELKRSPNVKSSEDLVAIAKPFTTDMTLLKPTLNSQMNEYVPIKISLSLTVIVFVLNLALHFLFMWTHNRFKVIQKYLPSFLNHEATQLRSCLTMIRLVKSVKIETSV